jgi:glycosyltransferase involved in cell wall biosynthesis
MPDLNVNQRSTIAIFANTAWYLWNFRLRLMEVLRETGYEVFACAPHDKYAEKITAAGFRFIPVPIDRRGTNPFIDTLLIARYCRIIRAERPDLILSYTPKPNIYATLAARLYGVPVINNIAGLGFIFIKGGAKASIVRMLYKVALAGSKRVFFQNREDLNEFVGSGLVKPDTATLLPGSGVDTHKFSPRPVAGPRRHFTFLLVARMLWDKGVGEYVAAATKLVEKFPDARFFLLGPPDPGNPASIPQATLEKWSRDGNARWLGSTDDVRDAIADADCVVLPSYREGIPRTLLEAASMAKPVITTDATGCREAVVDGLTGYLCKPRDVDDLAATMEKMLRLTPEKRQAMGAAGRERILREFDEKIVIERYLTAITAC